MPTDKSTPIWICDICGKPFGANLAAAQRCEDAGPPTYLPDGELALHHRDGSRRAGQTNYRLVVLHPLPDNIGSLAELHNSKSGHIARYEADGDRYDNRNRIWPATMLNPGTPGYLNVPWQSEQGQGRIAWSAGLSLSAAMHDHQVREDPEDTAWAWKLAGLPATAERLDALRHGLAGPDLVQPITPEVRAVLDMLKVTRWPYRAIRLSDRAASTVAAEATAARDGLPAGHYDPARILSWLAQADPRAIEDEVEARQQAWTSTRACPTPATAQQPVPARRPHHQVQAPRRRAATDRGRRS